MLYRPTAPAAIFPFYTERDRASVMSNNQITDFSAPMPEPDTKRSASLHYLEIALADAQATVRAYDTNAQIVGIGYTFAINIVAAVSDGFPKAEDASLAPVLIFWGSVMLPLFLFGYVLYPSRKTAPRIGNTSGLDLQRTLYIETSRHSTVEALKDAVDASDWSQELSYEVLKVSKLRELKRIRFIRALYTAAFSFAILFFLQVSKIL